MKQIQVFSSEYLLRARKIPPDEVLRFLEDFRLLHDSSSKSRLISMKVAEPLLRAFQMKCVAMGLRYQTKIKELMLEWLK